MSARRFIFWLAVTFCTLQVTCIEGSDRNLMENIKYQLLGKVIQAQGEIAALSNKISYQINKKSNTLSDTSESEAQKQGVEILRFETLESVEERKAEAEECILELKDKFDASMNRKIKVKQIVKMRVFYINKIHHCKKVAKAQLHMIMDNFLPNKEKNQPGASSSSSSSGSSGGSSSGSSGGSSSDSGSSSSSSGGSSGGPKKLQNPGTHKAPEEPYKGKSSNDKPDHHDVSDASDETYGEASDGNAGDTFAEGDT